MLLETSMNDTYFELQEFPVLRVKADMKGKGPSFAMEILESKLPTLKGRKFYGVFRVMPDGEEDYYACVARIESDDPDKMQLETGVIPGGKYARRKIINWERIIRDGQLPRVSQEFAHAHDVDPSRFSIEFYRSQDELQLFVPVRSSSTSTRQDIWFFEPDQNFSDSNTLNFRISADWRSFILLEDETEPIQGACFKGLIAH